MTQHEPAKVYRSVVQNRVVALAVVLVPLVWVCGHWYSDGSENVGTRITWWSIGFICLAASVGAVRAMRCGVVLTDTALVQRTLLFTRIIPWSRLDGFRFIRTYAHTWALTGSVDGWKFHAAVDHPQSDDFRASVRRARAAAMSCGNGHDRAWPPSNRYRLVVIALWISLAVILLGATVFELA